MNEKLKKLIFKKLYDDLAHAEVIECDAIWFIDRENEYWYLAYQKSGDVFYRKQFFTNFFNLFSMERHEFDPIIKEWVEEVLNCKVITMLSGAMPFSQRVEEVLNCNEK